jgi:hypothetical protein
MSHILFFVKEKGKEEKKRKDERKRKQNHK